MIYTLQFQSRRRVLAFVGAAALLFGLAMLHPFLRQSLFGPTIDGIPWCVWEEQFRQVASPHRERFWLIVKLEEFGLFKKQCDLSVDLESRVAFPLYLHLSDDPDVMVRQSAMSRLTRDMSEWAKQDGARIVSVCRKRLKDDDPQCRLYAARGLWTASKDQEAKAVVLELREDPDPEMRWEVASLLAAMASKDPDLFDALSKMSDDSVPDVRWIVVSSMRHFGPRGVPVIKQGLNDPVQIVLIVSMRTASELGKDAVPLYPDLIALKNHPSAEIRDYAAHALYRLDPKQFAKPATWVD